MPISSDQHHRNQVIQQHHHKSRVGYLLPMMAPFAPLLPIPALTGLGLAVGAYAAWHAVQAESLTEPADLHSVHQESEIEDGNLADRLYLGHAMDMLEYREKLNERETNRGRLSDDEREAFNREMLANSMAPLMLNDDFATRHVFVGGSTGVGKTELNLAIIDQQARRGGGCAVVDAKGGLDLITRAYASLKAVGREEDLWVLSTEHEWLSLSYNPLLDGDVNELVSAAMKLAGESTDPFWTGMNRLGLNAALVALKAQPGEPPFNFMDLAVLFTDPHYMLRLYQQIPRDNVEDRDFVYTFLNRWITTNKDGEEVLDLNAYKTFFTGLHSVMMDFAHTKYRRLLNDYSPGINVQEAIEEGKIVILSVPALADRESVRLFGKLFKADLARSIGRIQARGTQPPIPYYVLFDEYGSFKDESDVELWQLARSANISLWMSVQGLGFIADESEEFADNLLTNCWHHIYLDVRDPNTRERAATLAGTVVNRYTQDSVSQGSSYSHKNAETGAVRQESASATVSTGAKEAREEMLTADDFNLDRGDAILVGKLGNYRMRLPIMEYENEPKLEEMNLTYPERRDRPGMNLMEKARERGESRLDAL